MPAIFESAPCPPPAKEGAIEDVAEKESPSSFRNKYLDHLGIHLNPTVEELNPTKENLDKLIEAHVSRITFDNLSQHGLDQPANLDIVKTAAKILDSKRGGFCFETNALFAELLIDLGYEVKRVPSCVNMGGDVWTSPDAHILLIVGAPNDKDTKWLADVGFGEPALNSLRYELDIEQETPEGMISRIVAKDSGWVHLEWKKNGAWLPRLKWEWDHPGQPLPAFQQGLDEVLEESSIFSQKLIVCRITRDEKVTLAGNRLKTTTPRFGPDSKTTVKELKSPGQVKQLLKDLFYVPHTDGLDLTKSIKADKTVWEFM